MPLKAVHHLEPADLDRSIPWSPETVYLACSYRKYKVTLPTRGPIRISHEQVLGLGNMFSLQIVSAFHKPVLYGH